MDTTVWGPATWLFIHSAALAYSPSSKEAYKAFFMNLGDVLPCPNCRAHYKSLLNEKELDAALESPVSLFEYTVDFHNAVNRSLEKPEYSYMQAFEELKKKYTRRSKGRVVVNWAALAVTVSFVLFGVALGVFLLCKRYF